MYNIRLGKVSLLSPAHFGRGREQDRLPERIYKGLQGKEFRKAKIEEEILWQRNKPNSSLSPAVSFPVWARASRPHRWAVCSSAAV